MDKQIQTYYSKYGERFRKPIEMIVNKMMKGAKYINGESIERHNFGSKPVKLTNLPSDINSDNFEVELINSLHINNDKSIIELLWGDIQLGKRVQACIIMWISVHILRRPVLYIFRNLKIDKKQLQDDITGTGDSDFNIEYIKKIFEQFEEDISDSWKDFKLPELKDIDNSGIIDKLSNKEQLNPTDILCCLMNHHQLDKINNKMNEYIYNYKELVNITVITDESDLYAPSASNDNKNDRDLIDSTKCERLLSTIYKKVKYALHVTGTAHSLLYNTNTRLTEDTTIQLQISKVHKMKRTNNWYGLFNNNIDYRTHLNCWWDKIDPSTNKKSKYDIIKDYNINIKNIIYDIINRENTPYNSLLISEEKIRVNHLKLVSNIIEDFKDLFIIVFHGNCLRLYLSNDVKRRILKYCKRDCTKNITSKRLYGTGGIDSIDVFKSIDKSRYKSELPNNYCFVDIDIKQYNIKQIYKILAIYIKKCKKCKKCNTVITITGKFGERGYSFTSDDYGKYLFHLTDQYFPCHVKNKNCTDISQRLRIQGKYNDNPTQILWTTEELKDIMVNFYIPFMKGIEENIMQCETWEEIKELIEDYIDSESIKMKYIKYIDVPKKRKNISIKKTYDSKHKGFKIIKVNDMSDEDIKQLCIDKKLPQYECINEIKNDLSIDEFIEKYGDYNHGIPKRIKLLELNSKLSKNIEDKSIELKKTDRNIIEEIVKNKYSNLKQYKLDRIVRINKGGINNDRYNGIENSINKKEPYSHYITEKKSNTINILIYDYYENVHITIIKGDKILPKPSYKVNKSYYIDENKLSYSKLKQEYIDDPNYEESHYYWKTPDGWLYLHDPSKSHNDMYSINITDPTRISSHVNIQHIQQINKDILEFKNQCIKQTTQKNLRIGINDFIKTYKNWCNINNKPIINRKLFKLELSRIGINEEESKGVGIDGKTGKRGYNIELQ